MPPEDPTNQIARLTLENEQLRTFLQSWQADVGPLHDLMLKSIDNGHGFAKMTIQTLFVLNGGALVAFPTFANIAHISIADNLHFALASISAFVTGIVLATLTSLSAHLTCYRETQLAAKAKEGAIYRLQLSRDPAEKIQQWKSLLAKSEKEVQDHLSAAKQRRRITIALGVLSLTAFVAGALIAAFVLGAAKPV